MASLTGANTGIGFETAKALASKGYATVIACRNLEKGRAARDQIKYTPLCPNKLPLSLLYSCSVQTSYCERA